MYFESHVCTLSYVYVLIVTCGYSVTCIFSESHVCTRSYIYVLWSIWLYSDSHVCTLSYMYVLWVPCMYSESDVCIQSHMCVLRLIRVYSVTCMYSESHVWTLSDMYVLWLVCLFIFVGVPAYRYLSISIILGNCYHNSLNPITNRIVLPYDITTIICTYNTYRNPITTIT